MIFAVLVSNLGDVKASKYKIRNFKAVTSRVIVYAYDFKLSKYGYIYSYILISPTRVYTKHNAHTYLYSLYMLFINVNLQNI